LAEKWVKTTKHEGLYFEYWITFILYVLANTFLISNPTLFMGHPQYNNGAVMRDLLSKCHTR
jgi:hypothetical protein